MCVIIIEGENIFGSLFLKKVIHLCQIGKDFQYFGTVKTPNSLFPNPEVKGPSKGSKHKPEGLRDDSRDEKGTKHTLQFYYFLFHHFSFIFSWNKVE